MRKKVAVIIPFYQGREFIFPLIDSICSSNIEPAIHTIYIVDNDIEDVSMDTLQIEIPVCCIKTKAAIGYGRACNVGAKRAIEEGHDILFFINQDSKLTESCLQEMLDVLQGPEAANCIVVPIQKDYSFKHINTHFKTWILGDEALDQLKSRFDSSMRIDKFPAACFGMHSAFILQRGLFDPLFKMYGEDDDLLLRNGLSIQILLSLNAEMAHRHSHFRAENERKIQQWKRNSEVILYVRHKGGAIEYCLKSYMKKLLRLDLQSIFIFLKNDLMILYNYSKIKKFADQEMIDRIEKQIQNDFRSIKRIE